MSHTIYKVNDKRVKSVTTIINAQMAWNKSVLIGWTRKNCLNGDDSMAIMKDAGKTGTLAHTMIESFMTGGTVQLDGFTPSQISKAKTAYYGYLDWKEKNEDIGVIANELKLVSNKLLYGGTIDCIFVRNKKHYLLDFKTSNHCHDEYIVQLAAYSKLYEENYGVKIHGGIILKLNKDEKGYTEYVIKQKDINWGWKIFKVLLRLQNFQNNRSYKW